MAKYKFVNGVMVRDEGQESMPIAQAVPLAMVCTPDELFAATEACEAELKYQPKIPTATENALTEFSEQNYTSQFFTTTNNDELAIQDQYQLNDDKILESLTGLFAQYEIPIGMLSKLLDLRKYRLNFLMDDSGSMNSNTNLLKKEASGYMLNHFKSTPILKLNDSMTRLEEAEDRLHLMIDLIAYIPTPPINIIFMNDKSQNLEFTRKNQTPQQFADIAHKQIRAAFHNIKLGGTPTLTTLKESFAISDEPTLHYLFTDGEPSDANTDQISYYLKNRPHPETDPLTLISCTEQEGATEWMKAIEETGPYIAEVDDFIGEKQEVNKDQGTAFPYTKGMWLMSLLVGAINPDDLDAIDDSKPFSKFTLDNLLGREHTTQEYEKYFKQHPKPDIKINALYQQMATQALTTKQIIANGSGLMTYVYNAKPAVQGGASSVQNTNVHVHFETKKKQTCGCVIS